MNLQDLLNRGCNQERDELYDRTICAHSPRDHTMSTRPTRANFPSRSNISQGLCLEEPSYFPNVNEQIFFGNSLHSFLFTVLFLAKFWLEVCNFIKLLV